MDNISSNRIPEVSAGVRPLSTVLRTLEIVEHFAAQTRPQRLGEISDALGLSKATTYQRLFTLVSAGWLEQDDEGRYRLSMMPARLAAAALEQADLGTRADPALSGLVSKAGETASLSILDRGKPCIVARVESDSLLRADQKIGTYMALEGSASGRVLVAFADQTTQDRLRDGGETLPAPDLLEKVRSDGFAISSGYTQSGATAVAAPVFDIHGRCAAAVSLIAPEFRFDLDRFRAPLLDAAAELSNVIQGKTK